MANLHPLPLKWRMGKWCVLALLDFGWMGVCRSILFCPRLYTYKYHIALPPCPTMKNEMFSLKWISKLTTGKGLWLPCVLNRIHKFNTLASSKYMVQDSTRRNLCQYQNIAAHVHESTGIITKHSFTFTWKLRYYIRNHFELKRQSWLADKVYGQYHTGEW